MSDSQRLLDRAREIITMEAEAVRGLTSVIDDAFLKAIDLMLHCKGRVITTGMGKAGLIGRKVAATLASTGTPSFFVHPGEAIHGDLGMITSDDLVMAFSHRGQTEEVLRVLPYLKHFQVPLIAVTSNAESELAKSAEVGLILSVEREACSLNLAPTSSTTAMLALGDTLAIVLLDARGFGPDDYALRHPGGSLGRRLLTKVSDLMHKGDENPVILKSKPLSEAIFVMTRTKMAAASVVDEEGRLTGFFTDGDLRRYLGRGSVDLSTPISELMTKGPKVIRPMMMAVKALEILENYKIISLPVVNEKEEPIGLIHLHDITRAGIVI